MRAVAIDQGTTSTRAYVLDNDGSGEIVCARSHKQNYPKPGWVEHNPMELLNNVKTCLAAAGTVDAIGIANQGESCLAWDARSGTPISPVIVWQDRGVDIRQVFNHIQRVDIINRIPDFQNHVDFRRLKPGNG